MGPTLRRGFCLWLVLGLLAGPVSAAAVHPSAPAVVGRQAAPLDVVINEVAWMGTLFDANDEWIELYNNTSATVSLAGWHLVDDDTMNIALTGSIPPYGYYLLERTDDTTIPDIAADWWGSFGTGGLANAGEVLTLTDSLGGVVDTANVENGGSWPAGDNALKRSMERVDSLSPDADANWGSNTTWIRNGHDNGGSALNGTPKARNSLSWPDLALEKAAPPSAPVGAPLVYVITVRNDGPLAAPQVRITDTLPAGFVYQSYDSPYTCSRSGDELLCQAAEIPAASLGHITITGSVAVTASGTLLNQVWATTVITEITGTNNLARAGTIVQPLYPDLAAAKAGPAEVLPGDLLSYTLVVSNVGDLPAPAVRVTDTLPAEVSFLTQTSAYSFTQVSPQVLVWELGPLSPTASALLLVYGEVLSSAGGLLTNTLWASTPLTETSLDNNTATWTTSVRLPGEGEVVINEVAWAGHANYTSDEWIELYNASAHAVDLAGWTLRTGDGTPSITLSRVIDAGGYYLLERDNDNTVSDIPADEIYSGSLLNTGEVLTLSNAGGIVVDTANGDGGGWPGGTASPNYQSMERIDPLAPDGDDNWASNDMVHRNGLDAGGYPINGTPRALNSTLQIPDLSVSKGGPITVTPGLPITYTLVVSNVGAADAPDLRVTDTLPAHVTFVSQQSSYPLDFDQLSPQLLLWTAASLPSGTMALITVSGQVETTAINTLTNRLDATTSAAERTRDNNSAAWHTRVQTTAVRIYLPLVLKHYRYAVKIYAVLYDGYQASDVDEAVRLLNLGTVPVDLDGWELCKDVSGALSCRVLPASLVLSPTTSLWVARDAAAFSTSFGFAPGGVLIPWLSAGLANDGDEVVLRDDRGVVVDAVVFEGGNSAVPGWSGEAVYPYAGSGNFGSEGQILQRALDEATGLPVRDTDTAADWLQYADDPYRGRRVLYPGWDLEAFYQPLAVTEQASLTVAIAPDHAAEVFLQAVAGAQASVEAEFYDLKHYTITRALADLAGRGISVTVLLEGEPAGGLDDQERWACQQIDAAGGQCWFMFNENDDPGEYIFDRYTNLHSKVVLVDRQWVLISSQNPTHSGLPGDDKGDGTWGSRGVLFLTNAPSVVARVAQIFDADLDPAHHNDLTCWAADNPYGYGPPPPGFVPDTSSGGITYTVRFPAPLVTAGEFGFELFSAPEAALRSSDALLGLLGQAGPGATVYVQQMYEYEDWGDMPDDTPAPNLRLDAYLAAARRGARVRILLNSGAFGLDYADIARNADTLAYLNTLAYCEGLDLQARLGNPTDFGIHNKMVLVNLGGTGYAHIGSINGSETSSKINREVAVQVRSDEVYSYLAAMFESDWAGASYLLVGEVLYNAEGDDAGKEWVEILNPTDQPIDLSGWMLGDAAIVGEYGSGRYWFPAGTVIPPYGLLTIASLAQFVDFPPDLEFVTDRNFDDPTVPNMLPVASWEGFGFALSNEGDEVILLGPDGQAVDVLVYGNGSYPGVLPYYGSVSAGHSLERRPPERDTEYCSADFFDTNPPTPAGWPAGYRDCGIMWRANSFD